VRWDNGSYRFDPNARWPGAPLVTLTMEAAMMEAARRVDEQKHFVTVFRDPHQLLGVHDLPDPSEPLTDEEREIFGIVDGQHTVAEVVHAAPLCEYEAYEALNRMLMAHWIEFVGRKDPGLTAPTPVAPPPRVERHGPRWMHELVVAGAMVFAVLCVRLGAARLPRPQRPGPADRGYAPRSARAPRHPGAAVPGRRRADSRTWSRTAGSPRASCTSPATSSSTGCSRAARSTSSSCPRTAEDARRQSARARNQRAAAGRSGKIGSALPRAPAVSASCAP